MDSATSKKPMNLWPDALPGTCRPDQLGHPAAREIPSLTPFLLPAEGPARPLVVVCPGGGYGGRAAHEGVPIAEWLNSIGLHAAVCVYRVYPWLLPTPLMVAQRAGSLFDQNIRHGTLKTGAKIRPILPPQAALPRHHRIPCPQHRRFQP